MPGRSRLFLLLIPLALVLFPFLVFPALFGFVGLVSGPNINVLK